MSHFFNDGVIQGVLAVLIAALVLGIFGWLKFKRDERIVDRFLKQSGVASGHARHRKKRKQKEG